MGNYKNDKDFSLRNNKDRDRVYANFTDEQKAMFHSIKEHVFTFCEACTGSGKTLTSIAALLDMLANEEIRQIIYFQKVSERYLQDGFLPGTRTEKTEDLWDPFYGAMLKLGYPPMTVEMLIANGLIMLTTDSSLRGVNFENIGLCVDEAQNCDWNTLNLVFTRCHMDCHIVMVGDYKQKDNKNHSKVFIEYGDYLAKPYFGNKCKLTKNFRGPFSEYAENFVPSEDCL